MVNLGYTVSAVPGIVNRKNVMDIVDNGVGCYAGVCRGGVGGHGV